MQVARTLAWTLGLASLLVTPGSVRASEADIGEPVTRNGITVKAAYLTGAEMAPQPPRRVGMTLSTWSAMSLPPPIMPKAFPKALGFPTWAASTPSKKSAATGRAPAECCL